MTYKQIEKAVEEFQAKHEKELVGTARDLVGDGFVKDYYLNIASGFLWMYEKGLEDGKPSKRSRRRR